LFKKILVRKLGLIVVFAFLISGAVFIVLQHIAANQIDAKYQNASFVAEQMQKEVDTLQQYITENHIAIQNFYKITQWVDRDKVTAISLYYEDRLIYDSNISYRAGTLSSGIKRKPLPWETLYPIRFQDEEVQMSLTVYLEHHDYDMALLGNLTAFFVLFISIVLLYIHRKTSDILKLEQQVQLMQGGKLDTPVRAKGNDEISSLAESLDEMRRVFIRQIQEEKEAGISSKQFASTMAHDIRTPLAALIGYLDILIHNRTKDEEKRRQYLHKSAEKADQLKTLTDHLFDHFVLAQHQGELTGHENCIDSAMLETLVFDCVFLLESEGFRVKASIKENTAYRVHIHREPMQRILDNVVSNLLKYAAKDSPILVTLTTEHAFLRIVILNAIKVDASNTASTGLGLTTCRELLEERGGELLINESGQDYQVELKIPLD
jgi:signal transduction histidine kinase